MSEYGCCIPSCGCDCYFCSDISLVCIQMIFFCMALNSSSLLSNSKQIHCSHLKNFQIVFFFFLLLVLMFLLWILQYFHRIYFFLILFWDDFSPVLLLLLLLYPVVWVYCEWCLTRVLRLCVTSSLTTVFWPCIYARDIF
jgi:hypothetical protein